MKNRAIPAALAAGLLIGAVAATHAKLPASPPKSDAEKSAEAEKAKATATKDAEELERARERAVANYKKNKGLEEQKPAAAAKSGKK